MSFFLRLLLTLFGMAFAVLFTMGVLCWLAFYVAYALVRWLFTGKKPQVLLMWQQLQAMRQGIQTGQGATWSSWSRTSNGQWHEEHGYAQHSDSNVSVVEDVVVREVHETRYLPKD